MIPRGSRVVHATGRIRHPGDRRPSCSCGGSTVHAQPDVRRHDPVELGIGIALATGGRGARAVGLVIVHFFAYDPKRLI